MCFSYIAQIIEMKKTSIFLPTVNHNDKITDLKNLLNSMISVIHPGEKTRLIFSESFKKSIYWKYMNVFVIQSRLLSIFPERAVQCSQSIISVKYLTFDGNHQQLTKIDADFET